MKPRALDLFCGAGGVSVGLARAGFEVVGVDLRPMPRYRGGAFVQADALTFPLDGFDFIWASPPCQAYTALRSGCAGKEYPDLLPRIRNRLEKRGGLWVIENVPGSPIRRRLMLCGGMFGLRTYRHRYFELSFLIFQPPHPAHVAKTCTKKRRAGWDAGMHVSVTGDVGVYVGSQAMGIDWMTGNELSQAIPPAYAEWIARHALQAREHGEHGKETP